ncbi:hypothetical protein GCM10027297_17950 [Parahaliea aestuarii]
MFNDIAIACIYGISCTHFKCLGESGFMYIDGYELTNVRSGCAVGLNDAKANNANPKYKDIFPIGSPGFADHLQTVCERLSGCRFLKADRVWHGYQLERIVRHRDIVGHSSALTSYTDNAIANTPVVDPITNSVDPAGKFMTGNLIAFRGSAYKRVLVSVVAIQVQI